ncbi:MAG: dipeptide ABC transporter ATP-binding protein [Acidobacteriota bacterium]
MHEEISGDGFSGWLQKRELLPVYKMMSDRPNKDLLVVEGLKKYFPVRRGIFSRISGYVRAVDGISFHVRKGETFALVGESGSGKTTTGRLVLRLMEPTDGKIHFVGIDIFSLRQRELRKIRKRMQIIFQDPYSSLNPRMSVGSTVGEPLIIHRLVEKKKRYERIIQLLEMVGLEEGCINKYPHEFSGGQRQRIGIARALAVEPDLIVADEPVSALDVSVQAQIVNLLMELQERLGLTYLLIAHDLRLVRMISDTVAVMYLGKIVEQGSNAQIYHSPKHPYTLALLSSVPVPDPQRKKERVLLEGEIPTPINPPSGCRFRTRCPMAIAICVDQEPPLRNLGNGHLCACHLIS